MIIASYLSVIRFPFSYHVYSTQVEKKLKAGQGQVEYVRWLWIHRAGNGG